jgi:NTE family protein
MGRLALVLTGGGARAAYQAGALRALAELWPRRRSPFTILTGVSAGSINASVMAHHADDFQRGAERLWTLWNTLTLDKVLKVDTCCVARSSYRMLRGVLSGGMLPHTVSSHLLDNSPLKELLERHIDFARIHGHVSSGRLQGFAVSATNYHTGSAVTFFDAEPGRNEWVRSRHLGWRQAICGDHILASSSIPFFFPPIQLGGGAFYGDGTLRLACPLSPALRIGAEAVLAIGVNKPRDPARLVEQNLRPGRPMNLAGIAGVVLDAVFLDSLDHDLDRLQRMNRELVARPALVESPRPGGLRLIACEAIQPSRDLGLSAVGQSERFPFMLRHILHGLGVSGRVGSGVSSYLSFDFHYTGKLLRIGYNDAMDRRDALRHFMVHHAEI